ncbi:MAG: LLM class F420-dependent oxidoreductase [Acidimicrobiales bacterium]
MQDRLGLTIPLDGPLPAQRSLIGELAGLGYTDVWSAEASATDAFTPLALAGQWSDDLRLGTAIIPAFTRGPALIAQSIASLEASAPGRMVVGIGASSQVIVENWNAVAFERPLSRVRDLVGFLREALAGERVDFAGDTFEVRGFRLGIPMTRRIPILVAALRPRMLELAGSVGDGPILNWLSAADARRCAGIARDAGGDDIEVVARIFVCPTTDREAVVAGARRMIAAYLNVGVYRAYHEWLGRGEALGAHWERWDAGDRRGSLDEIPESVVDDLFVTGTPDQCRAGVRAYVEAGVTTPVIALMPFGGLDPTEAVRALAPTA